MVFEDITRSPGEGLEVQVHISPGVKSREMILAKEEIDDSLMDLPIAINPSSARFRRRSNYAISKSKNEVDLKQSAIDCDMVPHSHPGGGSIKGVIDDLSTLERSKSDITLRRLCSPQLDKNQQGHNKH